MSNTENNSEKAEQPDFQENSQDYEAVARDIKEGRLSSFIGGGTSLNGELSFRVMARVDGHLTGKVTSEKGTLVIGASGQVDAVISVATAIINGTINGDVTATEHLELKRTAKIVGNVRTPRLIMEDGAVLEGNCNMLRAEEKLEDSDARQFTAAPVAAAPTTTTTAAAAATAGAPATATTNAPAPAPVGTPAAKNNPPVARDNQLKDKESSETTGKNKDASKLILEVA